MNVASHKDRLESAPAFPASVYPDLPDTLRLAAGHFSHDHERDVFLTAALAVLSSCMPKAGAWHVDGWYTPHINTCVVAPASSGKGVMKYARRMGEGVNKMLSEYSDLERARWQDEVSATSKAQAGPEPPRRSLFVGANASSAAFIRALETNRTSCVFETEIDTLVAAQSQDWGNFSDVLRKAFHHEDVLVERVNERVTVTPILAMCLAGTPEQFLRLIGTAENGLFSRFGFYVFSAQDEYRSQRPSQRSMDRYHYFNDASERVREMFKALGQREERLPVYLSDEQWDDHDRRFSYALEQVEEQGRPEETRATVKRMGVVALRLATVLSILRAYDEDPSGMTLASAGRLVTQDADALAAFSIAETWLTHGSMLITHLPTEEHKIIRPKAKKERLLLAELPQEFSRAEAQIAGDRLGISTRSVDRYLKRLAKDGELDKGSGEDYGTYFKLHASPSTNGVAA